MLVRWRTRLLFTAGVLAASVGLMGCPKEPEVAQTPPPGPVSAAPPATAPKPVPPAAEARVTAPAAPTESRLPPPPAPQPAGATALGDVFFDFDRAAIRDDQRGILDQDVAWLRTHPEVKARIEGHCDERGTVEYNLALGDRRARAVRDYLVAAGVAAGRITTVSYGRERPFATGHDEAAWRANRRDHFAVEASAR